MLCGVPPQKVPEQLTHWVGAAFLAPAEQDKNPASAPDERVGIPEGQSEHGKPLSLYKGNKDRELAWSRSGRFPSGWEVDKLSHPFP